MTVKRHASVWDAIEDTPRQAENLKIRSALMQELTTHHGLNPRPRLQGAHNGELVRN